jgi:hypothetical protein
MSNERNESRFSARSGFFLGIGTMAIVAAVAVAALRYQGAKASTTPASSPAMATPAATESLPLADHVAAVSEGSDQAASTPAAASAGPLSPAKPGQVLLSGTIELDPSLARSVTGTMTVFVIARDRNGKGHPILARRLDVASFPTKFALGPEDSMMGQPPPDHVSLEARIDLDHDAMTREPDVPAAKIESVAIGSRNVTLTLKRGA